MTTVPTSIVDKNGKNTTVHKKADGAKKNARTVPHVKAYQPDPGVSGAEMDASVVGISQENRQELVLKFHDHLYATNGVDSYGTQSHRDIYDAAYKASRGKGYEGLENEYRDTAALMVSIIEDNSPHKDFKNSSKLDLESAINAVPSIADHNRGGMRDASEVFSSLDDKFTNYLIDDRAPGIGGVAAAAIASHIWNPEYDRTPTYPDLQERFDSLVALLNKLRTNEGYSR